MNTKNEVKTVYYTAVVYCSNRLEAMNIANMAFKVGLAGGVRRESDICVGPLDMYKVDVYGKIEEAAANRFGKYVRSCDGVSSFTDNDPD